MTVRNSASTNPASNSTSNSADGTASQPSLQGLASQAFIVNFIQTDRIDAYEHQARVHFDESEIKALSESIKQHGILQPILVAKNGDRFNVVAGERRLRAARIAGLDRVPARVISTSDNITQEIALRENLDRVDLHPIEEGEGYLTLLESKTYLTHESLAKAFGKSKSRITECVGFTRLPTATKVALLQYGLKNRALLRTLMSTPVEEQSSLIKNNLSQQEREQTDLTNELSTHLKDSSQSNLKRIKNFEYKMSKKGLVVPAFRWKAGQGKDLLNDYLMKLESLVTEIKSKL